MNLLQLDPASGFEMPALLSANEVLEQWHSLLATHVMDRWNNDLQSLIAITVCREWM